MDAHPAFVLVGFVAGLTSGLFGLGGGVVVVPTLVVGGAQMPLAVGTSVFVVLANALAGTAQHARQGNVRGRRGMGLAAGAIPLAFVGSYFAGFLPEALLRGLFVVMLVAGGTLLLRRNRGGGQPRQARGRWVAPATGGLAGLFAGLFGVGGGAFLVPLQVLLLGARMQDAVGTSLFVVIASTTVALATHAAQGHVVWGIGGLIALGGVVGSPVGALLAQRLGDRRLRVGFVLFLLALAVTMIVQTVRAMNG